MLIRSVVVASLLLAAPAGAQFGGLANLGNLGGLGKAGVGNATGLLGYCVKNKLLGQATGGGAAGVLGKLTGKPGVTQSPDYGHGLMDHLVTPTGSGTTAAKPLSLDSLPTGLRTKACDLVLKRAGSFL